MLTSIFNAFEQGGTQVTKRYGGLGLGLAICNGLVTMHDGSIHAASEGLGKGASFVVELPAPANGQMVAVLDAAGDEAAAPTNGGCRILLVEDHDNAAVVTARLLRSFGHQVATADSMRTALASFDGGERFDLIISDLGLPDGTGHDLIRQILAQRRLPAIALSGYGMDSDLQRSAQAGFLEHLVKPVNARQLEDAIARALGKAHRHPAHTCSGKAPQQA
jgi:CheY-like chemotaxis protein